MKEKQIEMEIRAYVGDDMDREKRDNIIHNIIAELLREKYQGKKLTARLASQVKERLPAAFGDPVVHYSDDYNLCQIMIWGGKVKHHEDHGKRLVFFITHKGEKSNCYDPATFESEDACHGRAAVERNAKRLELCQGDDLPKIATLIATIEKAREDLNALIAFGTPGEQAQYCPRVYQASHEPR